MDKELNETVDRLLQAHAAYKEFCAGSSATRNAVGGLKLPPLERTDERNENR